MFRLSPWRTALSTLVLSAHGHHGGSKQSTAIGSILLVTALLVACGDDDSDFVVRPSGNSLSSIKNVTPQSSDSETSVSSSSTKSSSSSEYARLSCDVETDENCFEDVRDGQTYKTVKIGDQVWMAENLNFETDKSTCYGISVEYCDKYGRLYTWAAAMDSAGTWSTNGKGCGCCSEYCSPTYPVRGVCPDGWHLPTQVEWNTLVNAVGDSITAGKVLKSTSGWISYNGKGGNGTDDFGFSALPAGYNGYGGGDSCRAYFWSSTEGYNASAISVHLSYVDDFVSQDLNNKYNGYSVRCVKD